MTDEQQAGTTLLDRILDYAEALSWRDYRGELANWQRDYEAVMARRPIPPSRPNRDATPAPEFSKREGREL